MRVFWWPLNAKGFDRKRYLRWFGGGAGAVVADSTSVPFPLVRDGCPPSPHRSHNGGILKDLFVRCLQFPCRAFSWQQRFSQQRELWLFWKRTRKPFTWSVLKMERLELLNWPSEILLIVRAMVERENYLNTATKSNVFWKIQVIMKIV